MVAVRCIEGDSKIHIFSLTQMLELTGHRWILPHALFFTLNLWNQIYASKLYDNYNIALHCGMYSRLIFLLRSSNFFLPFTCLCPFSGLWSSQGLCLSGPGCSLVLELCLFLSGSLSCLLDLLPSGSGSLVLVLQFWSPGSSGPGLMFYGLPGRWLHCIM